MATSKSRADDDLDDEEIELIKKHRASKQGSGRTVRVWEVPEEYLERMFGGGDQDDDDGDGDGDTKQPEEGKKRRGWFD